MKNTEPDLPTHPKKEGKTLKKYTQNALEILVALRI